MEIYWNKISLKGCKWSCLNALGSESPISHPLLKSFLSPFQPLLIPSFLPTSGVIRIGLLWEAGPKVGNLLEQNQFDRLQMVQLECPRVRNPSVSSTFEEIHLPNISPSGANKIWFIMGGWVKRWKFFGTRSV